MPKLFNRSFTKDELLARVGRLDQVAGIRTTVARGGFADGVEVYSVDTGSGLSFDVARDLGLDIPMARYNGRPLCWYGSNGLVGPQAYSSLGFLRSFAGGLLVTCGLRTFGAPSIVDGEEFALHGAIGHTPAESASTGTSWRGDECTLWVQGVIRETSLFGANLTLTRRIEADVGGRSIRVSDVVRNEAARPEGHMLLYHVNAGFPLLDAGARLVADVEDVHPRDPMAATGLTERETVPAPDPGFAEQVFTLTLRERAERWTTATLVNPALDGGLALQLRFRKDQLPWMFQWRQFGQSTYVLGLEPANSPAIEGRAHAVKTGALPTLAPGEERRYDVELEVLVGDAMPAATSDVRR